MQGRGIPPSLRRRLLSVTRWRQCRKLLVLERFPALEGSQQLQKLWGRIYQHILPPRILLWCNGWQLALIHGEFEGQLKQLKLLFKSPQLLLPLFPTFLAPHPLFQFTVLVLHLSELSTKLLHQLLLLLFGFFPPFFLRSCSSSAASICAASRSGHLDPGM